jgi:lipopolysaccharide transport system permease protein
MGTISNSMGALQPPSSSNSTIQGAPPAEAAPDEFPAYILPAEPIVTIQPAKAWIGLDLRDVWTHRELLYFLTWRDLKIRYKQTALGVAWVVLQPLLTTLIFTVFLGTLARVPSDSIPYPLFVYVGLMPWTFFSTSVLGGASSLVSSAHVITKVYFPRLLVPSAAIAARLVDFAIAFIILVGMMVFYQVAVTWNMLMLPVMVLLTTMLALGVGLLTAALNVRYRDVTVILPVLMQLWMFVSPVLYPASLVPGKWRLVYSINPIVGIAEGFRAALLGGPFNWPSLLLSAGISIVVLVISAYTFRRFEKSFADTI